MNLKNTHNTLKGIAKIIPIWLILLLSSTMSINIAIAQDIDKSNFQYLRRYTLPYEHAKKLAYMPIQLRNGRISTFEIFSNRLLQYINIKQTYENHTTTQIVMGFILYPEIWNRVPIIYQDNRELANLLGTGNKHLSYNSLFDGRGRYILESYTQLAKNTPEKDRTELEKQILILNSKVIALSELRQAKLIPMFPLPGSDEPRWYSPGERYDNTDNMNTMREIEELFVFYLSQVTEAIHTGDWSEANNSLDKILAYQIKYAAPQSINIFKLKMEMLYGMYSWNPLISYGYLVTAALLILLTLTRLWRINIHIPNERKIFYLIFHLIFGIHTLSICIQAFIYEGRFWMSHPVITALFAWIIAFVGISFKNKSSIGLLVCLIISGTIISFIDSQPHHLEDYRYVISQESNAVRVYYTMILCSLALLIISSLASLILIVFSLLQKHVIKATPKIKELLRLSSTFTTLGLTAFIVSAVIRLYISVTLANSTSWVWVDEYKWIAITIISYLIVLVLQRMKKRNFFLIRQSASVFALIIMILSFYSLYH